MGNGEDLFPEPTPEEIQHRDKECLKVALDEIQENLIIIRKKLGTNVSVVDYKLDEIDGCVERLREKIV